MLGLSLLLPVLAPLASIDVPDSVHQVIVNHKVSVSGLDGSNQEYYDLGQPVILSTRMESPYGEVNKSAIQIIDIRDSRDISVYLAWSSVMLRTNVNITTSLSWIPEFADDYQVRSFLIDNFKNPEVLTPLSSMRLEVLDGERTPITFIDRPPNITFKTANITLEEAQQVMKQVYKFRNCTLYSYSNEDDPEQYASLMPQIISFEYLKLPSPALLLNCFPYRGATINLLNGTIVSTESILKVQSPEQAVEYLHYFVLGGSMLYTEEDYEHVQSDASLVDHSPIRRLHVLDNGDSFTVKLNVLNVNDSTLTYQRWNIKEDAGSDGFHEWSPEYSELVAKLGYAA